MEWRGVLGRWLAYLKPTRKRERKGEVEKERETEKVINRDRHSLRY